MEKLIQPENDPMATPLETPESSEVSDKKETKAEIRDFSKEFSPMSRSALAREILVMRKRHRENIEVNSENEKIRTEAQAEIDAINQEEAVFKNSIDATSKNFERLSNLYNDLMSEVHGLRKEISREKSKIWSKAQQAFGLNPTQNKEQELSKLEKDVARVSDDRQKISMESGRLREEFEKFSDEDRPNIYRFIEIVEEAKETVIDENHTEKIKSKLEDFYREQGLIKTDYENSYNDRNLALQTEKHNALFLHGIPTRMPHPDTIRNSTFSHTNSFEAKAAIIASLQPAISGSTKSLSEAKEKLYYNTGVILGGGEILSAYHKDNRTVGNPNNFDIKARRGAGSSIEKNISEKVESAINQHDDQSHNEIVIRRPEICAVYVNGDVQLQPDELNQLKETAKKLNVPLIKISDSGTLENFDSGETETLKNLIDKTVHLTPEERLELLSQTATQLVEIDPTEPDNKTASMVQKRIDQLRIEKAA